MHEVSAHVWQNLPTVDFRNRFFIEIWKEILYIDTPSFYQAKTMNTMSGAAEIIECVDDYIDDPKNGKHLIAMIEDFHGFWKSDDTAKDVYSNLYKKISELFSITENTINKAASLEIKTFCRLILAKEKEYFEALKRKLKQSVLGSTDLSQKNRITKEIQTLSKSFIGYLLWKGYSPTYLYNRMEMLTRIKNYGKRDFNAQFNSVLDKLTTRIHQYDVYFAIGSLHKYLRKITELLDVSFVPYENQINEDYFKRISQGLKTTTLAKITVSSTDYVSAAWEANEILDKAIDYIAIEKPMHKVEYSPLCFTKVSIGNIDHNYTINIGRLKQFITSKKTNILENIDPARKSQFRDSIRLERYDVLTRSLRYLRIAKDSTSLEQKLINIWISIECLFEKTEGNIISGISKYAPRFFAINGILSRIIYSKSLLSKRLNPIPEDILFESGIAKNKFSELSIEEFFNLIKLEGNRHKIYSKLNDSDEQFIIFRLINIYEDIGNNKKIKDRLTNTQKDVERQIYRIYRLRNKLAHRAFHGNVRPQFVDNLITYLLSSYSVFILFSSYDHIECFNSQDTFNIFEASYECILSGLSLEKDLKDINLSSLLISSQF